MQLERSESEIRQLFEGVMARQPFIRALGVHLVEFGPGRCVLGLALRADHMQHGGSAHGGVLGTLADNAAGAAASTVMPAGFAAVTAEYRISFLAPAIGEALRAEGQVLRPGRSIVHTKADVFALPRAGEPRRHVATLLATMVPFELPKG
jgi:uncharacterized protein (TIGR00369 family)